MNSSDADSISDDAVQSALIDALGEVALEPNELIAFAKSLQQHHGSVMRLRRGVSMQELPFQSSPVEWYALGRRLTDSQDRPSRHLLYAAGDYFLQDAGSLLALAACGADEQQLTGLTVCDLCAAPGGKASGLLEAIGDRGFLLANEPIRSRIAPLTFNLARTGSDRFAVSNLDPERLAETLPGQFDLVLVDAPCSGQALMGRGKQTTAALSAKQIQHSAARQERILKSAVRLLCPGGRLVYSTCTFAHAENEAQVDGLVESGLAEVFPIERLEAYHSGAATYRLWPHRHRCAGSFAASMKVTDDAVDDVPIATTRRKSKKRKDQEKDDLRLLKSIALTEWYDGTFEPDRMKITDSVLYAWPSGIPAWVKQVAVDGPEVAHRTGQTWKPAHAGALRRDAKGVGRDAIDVDAMTAIQFLGGATIPCDCKGWHVVRYRDRPLGWIKASGGMGKNQLPAAARFRGPLTH